MIICPFCKADIDDDSFFCDQCGKEILICPKCNKPGKGKVCTSDGTPLVSKKSKMASSNVAPNIDQTTSIQVASSDNVTPTAASFVGEELHLINRTLGLDLKIDRDVLIGRTEGDFVDIFGKYDTVSGRHLKITFDPQRGWIATDLGSTNGTKYNNVNLVPHQGQVLSDKSYLQIANIEFYIEIKKPTGKTGTVRL